MPDKRLKRLVFLRKMLENLGFSWELVLDDDSSFLDYDDSVQYRYVTKFKGKPITSKWGWHKLIDRHRLLVDGLDDTMVNVADMKYGLTITLLQRFYYFQIARALINGELLERIKHLRNIVKIGRWDSIEYAVNAIDFEQLLQNAILDGVQLDGLPDIEEVI